MKTGIPNSNETTNHELLFCTSVLDNFSKETQIQVALKNAVLMMNPLSKDEFWGNQTLAVHRNQTRPACSFIQLSMLTCLKQFPNSSYQIRYSEVVVCKYFSK